MPPARQAPSGDFFDLIASGDVRPIYALHGEEPVLVSRAVNAISTAVLGEKGGIAGMNRDVFDCREGNKESTIEAALTTARTLPMFAKRRLVIVENAELLKANLLDGLAAYAAEPNPSTVLVIVGNKLDGRYKAFAAIKKAQGWFEFGRLKSKELVGWVSAEARRRKISLAQGVAELLAETAGPDLGRLAQALEQLELYAGVGSTIELAHVETLIPETRERGVFELLRAIAAGNRDESLRLCATMLRDREEPLMMQFMIMRQLRQIWRAKELAAQGAGPDAIASELKIPPFAVRDLVTAARRLTHAQLLKSYDRAYETGRTLKGSRVEPEVQILRLVRDLADAATSARPR